MKGRKLLRHADFEPTLRYIDCIADFDRRMHSHVIRRNYNLGQKILAGILQSTQRRRVERSAVAAAEWKLCK